MKNAPLCGPRRGGGRLNSLLWGATNDGGETGRVGGRVGEEGGGRKGEGVVGKGGGVAVACCGVGGSGAQTGPPEHVYFINNNFLMGSGRKYIVMLRPTTSHGEGRPSVNSGRTPAGRGNTCTKHAQPRFGTLFHQSAIGADAFLSLAETLANTLRATLHDAPPSVAAHGFGLRVPHDFGEIVGARCECGKRNPTAEGEHNSP